MRAHHGLRATQRHHTGAPVPAVGCGGLERDLVQEIRVIAKAMNIMLCEVGQYRAKSSGTTPGFPDLVAIAGGRVTLIETKRAHVKNEGHGVLSIGQVEFIRRAAEQGVHVFVIDRAEDAVAIFNAMRRPRPSDAPPCTDRERAPR